MKHDLILITELRHGHQDMLNCEYVGPSLLIRATNRRVALKVVEIPEGTYNHRGIPDFLHNFGKMYKDALMYLLEDTPEIPRGQCVPECTFQHLTQLDDFLKETI